MKTMILLPFITTVNPIVNKEKTPNNCIEDRMSNRSEAEFGGAKYRKRKPDENEI